MKRAFIIILPVILLAACITTNVFKVNDSAGTDIENAVEQKEDYKEQGGSE